MATRNSASATGTPASPKGDGRFLGVTNPQDRTVALAMPLPQLKERLAEFFNEQALASQQAEVYSEALDECVSGGDSGLVEGLDGRLRKLDDGLCTAGGYCEALVMRLESASTGDLSLAHRRVVRLLAMVDMIRSLNVDGGPGANEATDGQDKLDALISGMSSELESFHAEVSGG